MKVEKIRQDLFSMQDLSYRDFYARLMPTVDPARIIGIRVPQLRSYAKRFMKEESADEFLALLPHEYYEENNLHAFLIELVGDYSETVRALHRFLPFVDNWATCDMMRPKVFRRYTDELYPVAVGWIGAKETYTVRYGIGILHTYYMGDAFNREHLSLVASLQSEEYYVQMMAAWYFATALDCHYEDALPYVEEGRMSPIVQHMTIRKAIESRRISIEHKMVLRDILKKTRK